MSSGTPTRYRDYTEPGSSRMAGKLPTLMVPVSLTQAALALHALRLVGRQIHDGDEKGRELFALADTIEDRMSMVIPGSG